MNAKCKSVLLATDGSASIPVEQLAHALNQVCKYIRFDFLPTKIALGPGPLSNPSTYSQLEGITRPLLEEHSAILIASDCPYDNNYFFDSDENVIVLSFWNWEALTNLAKTNGLVGFIISILALQLDNSIRHDENTGCVYDFLWDKSGVDARLRSGVMCRDCYARVKRRAETHDTRLGYFDSSVGEGLEDVITLLDEVALASRRELDILMRWSTKAGVTQDYDVFLCHNSEDKPSVRDLYGGLVRRGIKPWFDEEHLRPGQPWQRELEATIPRIRSAAVVVGPNGRGPWQDIELDAFLREFVNRACPVIPVLLRDVGETPVLPLFLRAFTWVDFRKDNPDPWRQLLWGITGKRPQ